MAQGPEPVHDGELAVSGLNDTVEIFCDEWGVPHIYASNTYDLLFAQGYTQAQDRWWQMEFFRHTAAGEIQELTGRSEGLMGTDAYLRTLGFREVAERELEETYDDETITILQAFADGVNAYIEDKEPTELAYEYGPLGLTGVSPEVTPWSPVDTIMWGKVMALNLGGNQGSERRFSRLFDTLSVEMVADYAPDWPYDDKPTILQPEDLPIMDEAPLTQTQSASLDRIGAGITGLDFDFIGGFELANAALPFGYGDALGSNNWVVDGSLSETGMPLMANDMHLGIQMPSIWYEIGLHCQPVGEDCPYNVTGFTFSPSPLVIAGHNDDIAWAHTNVSPDTQDLYQIRVNPEDPLQYEWDGDWRDMTLREETLEFGNDAEPVTFNVRETHLGPIINDSLDGFNNENPLALRWTALEPGTLMTGVIRLNSASNWEEFRDALTFWDSPSQNVIYADTEGNIGYQVPGRIPVRAGNHLGELPVPGWTSDYEWRGYIPFDYLPRIWNPDRGYIATANQVVVPPEFYDQIGAEIGDEFGDDPNFYLHQRYAYGYRGERINNLLEELAPHNAATFQQIHADNYDGSAEELLPFFGELTIDDDNLADVRDWLVSWDYQADLESPQAALWYNTWVILVDNLYQDQLGDIGASGSGNEWWAAYLLMQEPENIWWDDVTTPDITETRDDILLRSLQAGYDATVEALGDDRDTWRWGDLHTTTFVSDPLGRSGIGPVENVVNRGPFPTAGTSSAVNATGWNEGSGDFGVTSGPSERVVYDVSDWSQSLSMHTTGQSGHPGSENYDDMIEPWITVEYKPMLWTRTQVEAAAVDTLILTPGE